jgi:hypothetical protein
MRAFFSVILVTALLATDAFAGPGLDNPLNKGGLAPGKPAGLDPAQSVRTLSTVVLGAGAVLGIMLALQSHGAEKIVQSTAPVNAADIAVVEGAALNTTQ